MDFSGEYKATLDEKGRVVLPVGFKNQMGGNIPGDQMVIQLDPHEKCLNIYPIPQWEIKAAKIKEKLNPEKREHGKLLDFFYSRFKTIPVPETCRLNIPNDFLGTVGITKEVTFAGAGERIRLWDIAEYSRYKGSLDNCSDLWEKFIGGE
jgi:MraZ protein